MIEGAVVQRRVSRAITMRGGKLRSVVADVDADRVPIPLRRDVQKSTDVTSDLQHARTAGEQRTINTFLQPERVDVRAEHSLHHVRRVRLVGESAGVVVADQQSAFAATTNG